MSEWRGKGWKIGVSCDTVDVQYLDELFTLSPLDAAETRIERSRFRWYLSTADRSRRRLRGLTKRAASEIEGALGAVSVVPRVDAATTWFRGFAAVIDAGIADHRWIAREQFEPWLASRPEPGLRTELDHRGIAGKFTRDELAAVDSLDVNLETPVDEANRAIFDAEYTRHREFFDRIERSPLTLEQARAVVCFDNRVQVLAAAGSGKTSVMVARAAYAAQRRFVAPERILLLAFNRSAAAELQQRVNESFARAGIDATGVRCSTFHAFGLEVLGRSSGAKPRPAPWLEAGEDLSVVERIVDGLRDRDPSFRYNWDLYRMLFASAPNAVDEGSPDAYEPSTSATGFRTFRGELVKSAGERLIADWLYLNGVEYLYEHPYTVDVATATHSQYRPDFYYPTVDVWHEHWALDRDGKPPSRFAGYADSMRWRRETHARHRTTLVESTWADVMFGDGLAALETALAGHGIKFDWNPDRALSANVRPLGHADLARLMRTFMSHVKSNALTETELERRLGGERRSLAGFRTRLFLSIYWPIHHEWNQRLRAENFVDFDDMLLLAADELDGGAVDMGFDLICVDEFQDASQARARLVRGLLSRPQRHLLAVGDDWQAINRFAGADISVMHDFQTWFGQGPQLALTTTFRCSQTICDVASEFVMRNPHQFRKTVRSSRPNPGPPVTMIRTNDIRLAVKNYLEQLSAQITERETIDGVRTATVDVLGRYRFDRDVLPTQTPHNLFVTFRTIHTAKGLEADYIVVPRLTAGRYGFPSEIADDPVLDLAMAVAEAFPNSEERRLLYVALTRARQQVTLITQQGRESRFATELMRHRLVATVDESGTALRDVALCNRCGDGTMVERRGRYGRFLGCSRFPACKNTRRL